MSPVVAIAPPDCPYGLWVRFTFPVYDGAKHGLDPRQEVRKN